VGAYYIRPNKVETQHYHVEEIDKRGYPRQTGNACPTMLAN